MSDGIRVVLVGESAADAVAQALATAGLDAAVHPVTQEAELEEAFATPPDIVLLALPLPSPDPLDVLRRLRKDLPDVPVIALVEPGREALAAEYLRCGVSDYVATDDLQRLGAAVRGALENRWLLEEARTAEATIIESRTTFAAIFQCAPVALAIVDDERRVVAANTAAVALGGGQAVEGRRIGNALRCLRALREPDGCGFSPDCPGCPLRATILDTLQHGVAHARVECTIPVGSDAPLVLLVSTVLLDAGKGRRVIIALEDITERRASEAHLTFLNRLLYASREVHRLMAEEGSREWLLAESCNALAVRGEFPLVAAAVADGHGDAVRLVAVAGSESEALPTPNPFGDEAVCALEPVRTAIREGRPVVVEDLATLADGPSWLDTLRARGLRSLLALPLAVEGTTVASLAIFARTPRSFAGEALALQEGLAADLSVALSAIEERERRRRAEAALAERERNYREIFDSVNEAIFIDDAATGRMLDVNATMLRMYGYDSKDEILAGDIGDLSAGVSPYDQTAAMKLVRAAVEEGPQTFEWLARKKNGELFWVEVSLRGTDIGGRGRVLAVVRDISDRKAAEKALMDSEARFRTIFYNSPVGIYRTTPDGHVIAANPALVRMLGYDTFEELATRNLEVSGFAPGGPSRSVFSELMARDGRVSGLESTWRTRDGRTIWVREHATAVRGEDGEIAYYEGSVEDITERKAAEEALRASEARYRSFFEEDLTADFIADGRGTLVDCNPAYLRLFGFADRAEALATPLDALFAESDERHELLAALRQRRRLELVALKLRRRDGAPLHVLGNVIGQFDAAGTLSGIKGYLVDITERTQLEEQLRHAQKMEAVGRLAGGVAHDFNNLLQAMLSYLTLLKASAGDPARVVAGLEELERAVRRGAALTRQLLVFSRRGPAQFESFDLGEFLRQSESFFRHLLRENIDCSLEVADGHLPIVGDRRQIEQVLMNLMVNAADAMPSGGTLAIRCRERDHDFVLLEVADNGCGMSEEVREKIFEPFFTTKPAHQGTGLGLAVVHGIVGQHGGRIEVASNVGEGTTFRILLPRAGSGAHPAVDEAVTPTPLKEGRGERILVVEDDEVARESLREILTVLGYTVEAVGSAAAALALPAEEPYELLLTDVVLPDVQGTTLAAELQRRWPTMAVLLMSGYSEDLALRDEIERGTVHFLQKPFDMETLAREVRGALARHVG